MRKQNIDSLITIYNKRRAMNQAIAEELAQMREEIGSLILRSADGRHLDGACIVEVGPTKVRAHKRSGFTCVRVYGKS